MAVDEVEDRLNELRGQIEENEGQLNQDDKLSNYWRNIGDLCGWTAFGAIGAGIMSIMALHCRQFSSSLDLGILFCDHSCRGTLKRYNVMQIIKFLALCATRVSML